MYALGLRYAHLQPRKLKVELGELDASQRDPLIRKPNVV